MFNQIGKQTRIAKKTIKQLVENEGEGELHLTLRLKCRKGIEKGVRDWYTWISWQSVIEESYQIVGAYLKEAGDPIESLQQLHDDLIDLEQLAWNVWADSEKDETQLVAGLVGVA